MKIINIITTSIKYFNGVRNGWIKLNIINFQIKSINNFLIFINIIFLS